MSTARWFVVALGAVMMMAIACDPSVSGRSMQTTGGDGVGGGDTVCGESDTPCALDGLIGVCIHSDAGVTCCTGTVGANGLCVAKADAGMCPSDIVGCPEGVLTVCDNAAPDEMLASCCDGIEAIPACHRPAGLLTHDCATNCSTGECAVSPGGFWTCCNPDLLHDPCATVVP